MDFFLFWYLFCKRRRRPLGMKCFFLFFLTTITGGAVRSQSKRLDPQSDTTFWCALKRQDAARIGLADLTIANDSMHLRYWMENQAIDIWTNDFVNYRGIISNHTETVDTAFGSTVSKPVKYFSNKVELTASQAKKVFELFRQAHIFSIPSDNRINGWALGDDGEEFLLECTTGRVYSFKCYWTPSAQHAVPEANVLNELNGKLRLYLKMEDAWSDFLTKLPAGCYREGEMLVVWKIGTKGDGAH